MYQESKKITKLCTRKRELDSNLPAGINQAINFAAGFCATGEVGGENVQLT